MLLEKEKIYKEKFIISEEKKGNFYWKAICGKLFYVLHYLLFFIPFFSLFLIFATFATLFLILKT